MRKKDLIEFSVYIIVIFSVWQISFQIDLMDKIVHLFQKHEHIELDEFFPPLFALLVCVVIFAWRRMMMLAEAQKRLIRAEEVRSSFLSHMSHQIRTPMNAVMGTLSLLKAGPLDEEQQHYVYLAEEGASQTLIWLTDALELAGLDTLSREKGKASVNLLHILTAVQNSHAFFLEESHPRLHVRVDSDVQVWGNPLMLERMLSSFLAYLLRQNPRGELFISTDVREDGVHLLLEDSGPAFSAEIQTSLLQVILKDTLNEPLPAIYDRLDLSLVLALESCRWAGGVLGYHAGNNKNHFTIQLQPYSEKKRFFLF